MKRNIITDELGKIEDFPTIPAVAMKVNRLIEDPDSSAADLHYIITQDVSLASKILKAVNSAYYGFQEKISSIKQAVVILGFNIVKQLAFSASVMDSFRSSEEYGFSRDQFWIYSVAVGTCSRLLASKYNFNKKETEEIFTCGLLHDIGILVEEVYFPEEFKEIILLSEKEDLFLWEAESRVLGINHSELGKWLSKKWNFHSHLRDTISLHHSVDSVKNSLPEKELQIVSIIALSDVIVKVLRIGSGGDVKIPQIEDAIKTTLKITQKTVQELIVELRKEQDKIMDFVKSVGNRGE